MLTKKELLKYKKLKDKIYPHFIDAEDEMLNNFSRILCEEFMVCDPLGKIRKELEFEFDEIVSAFDFDNTVIQGLKKLCFDLFTFENTHNFSVVEFRNHVFQSSFKHMQNSPNNYQEFILEEIKRTYPAINTTEQIQSTLYSDLPEFHAVTEIKPIITKQLLNKYNISLVQGFLFYCTKINIVLPLVSQCKAQFRQLLKHIKFFQLVVKITKKEDEVQIEIDGPLSLFAHTHKYGFNLACFFPSLLQMPQWQLFANIELGKLPRQSGQLHLSHKIEFLKPLQQKNYSAYIPEEFKLFKESFIKQGPSFWKLNDHCDEILFDGDNYFFPDFEFIHENGTHVYCELFHPWHGAALSHRLFSLAKKQISFILILGVSKILLKDSAFLAQLEQYSYFTQFSFQFRDVIVPEKILSLLAQFQEKGSLT